MAQQALRFLSDVVNGFLSSQKPIQEVVPEVSDQWVPEPEQKEEEESPRRRRHKKYQQELDLQDETLLQEDDFKSVQNIPAQPTRKNKPPPEAIPWSVRIKEHEKNMRFSAHQQQPQNAFSQLSHLNKTKEVGREEEEQEEQEEQPMTYAKPWRKMSQQEPTTTWNQFQQQQQRQFQRPTNPGTLAAQREAWEQQKRARAAEDEAFAQREYARVAALHKPSSAQKKHSSEQEKRAQKKAAKANKPPEPRSIPASMMKPRKR